MVLVRQTLDLKGMLLSVAEDQNMGAVLCAETGRQTDQIRAPKDNGKLQLHLSLGNYY